MLTTLKQFFCQHDWTCKAEQGIPPPEGKKDLLGFYEYAAAYCIKCGKISDISKAAIQDIKKCPD